MSSNNSLCLYPLRSYSPVCSMHAISNCSSLSKRFHMSKSLLDIILICPFFADTILCPLCDRKCFHSFVYAHFFLLIYSAYMYIMDIQNLERNRVQCVNIEIVRVECMDFDLRIFIVFVHKTQCENRERKKKQLKQNAVTHWNLKHNEELRFEISYRLPPIPNRSNYFQIFIVSLEFVEQFCFFFPPYEKSQTSVETNGRYGFE